jgi:hypothetical protein
MTANPASMFAAASDMGNIYFGGGSNIVWGSSVSSNSTSIMATAGGGSGGAGIALAFSGNTTGTTATLGGGTIRFVGGNNITLSQAGSIITISAGASGGAVNWNSSSISGTNATISTGNTNTLYMPNFVTYSGNVYFSNISNGGITFGSSTADVNTTITASVNAGGGSGVVGTGFSSTTIGSNVISGSLRSNGLSLWVPNYLTTQTIPTQFAGIVSTGITGGSATINSSQVQLNIPTGSVYFSNANNMSFGISTSGNSSTVTASYPVGSVYFVNANGFSFSTSINGVSTSIYIVT